jgi:hypothetical protein
MITQTRHANLREGWIDFLTNQNFTHGLTLHWHKPISQVAATDDLKYIHMRIDRELLGPRFHKRPDRTEAIFFFEGQDKTEGFHCHSLWRIAPEHRTIFEPYVLNFNTRHSIWKQIAPLGSSELRFNGQWNGHGLAAAIYDTKEITYRSTDRVVFSADFIKERPVSDVALNY